MESGGTASAALSDHAADEGAVAGPAVDGKTRRKTSRPTKPASSTKPATVVDAGAGGPTVSGAGADASDAAPAMNGADTDASGAASDAGSTGAAGPDAGGAGEDDAGGGSGHGTAEPVAEAISRARRAARRVRSDEASQAQRQALVLDFFAQPVRDYVYRSLGRPVTVLRAGCVTPLAELGLDQFSDDGFDISVVTVDADHDRRAPTEPQAEPLTLDEVTVGDLRAIPLPPRSFDVVYCSLLLDRISHAQLVLDRFAASLRPGGLLLLRIKDRDTAAGFIDRRLPGWARRALWTRLHPDQPGPFPAIYDRTGSGKGIAAYVLMRGLVITQRKTASTLPHQPERLARVMSLTRGLIARLSRGRLTDAHDEMLFVIRKPEDRFARVVLTPMRPGGVTTRD